jgi:hypothetical protein
MKKPPRHRFLGRSFRCGSGAIPWSRRILRTLAVAWVPLAIALAVLAEPASRVPPGLEFISRQAMTSYDGGRYEEALHLFEAYASSGGEGAEVRYDMGNCALKAGNLGRAVLEYRKALRYDPDFQAARNNLEVARKLMPARKSPWQPPPWEAFLDGIPVTSIQWVVLGFALLANLAFCAALLVRPGRGRRVLAGAVVGFLTAGAVAGGLLFYAGSILPQRRPAVVVLDAPVYPGPAAEGTPVDRLPPGSEVMLLKQAGDWRLVLWGDGRGWVPSTLVEVP